MKTVQIELDKKQFIKIIKELDEKDRFQLYNELKKSLYLITGDYDLLDLVKIQNTNVVKYSEFKNIVSSV